MRITLMWIRIRILLFTLIRIRFLLFTLIQIRIRFLLFTLIRIRIRFLLFGSGPQSHLDADPDPSLLIKAQNLEKVLRLAHIPYILACHLQIDADPRIQVHLTTLMRIRIQLITLMRIRIQLIILMRIRISALEAQRIRIKMKSCIRICIKLMRIRKPFPSSGVFSILC
jgi:hypothetical protein